MASKWHAKDQPVGLHTLCRAFYRPCTFEIALASAKSGADKRRWIRVAAYMPEKRTDVERHIVTENVRAVGD